MKELSLFGFTFLKNPLPGLSLKIVVERRNKKVEGGLGV